LRVSLVIPVHNGGAVLRRCLEGMATSNYPLHEWILVDDASTDGETEGLAETFGARVIRLTEQGGPARARNIGAEAATGDLLFFVDADVVVQSDTLEVGVGALEDHPDTAAVFGSYDDRPGDPSFLSQYRNLFHHWVHQTSSERACTFWTGCGLIRREVFLAIGGFKTSYGKPSIEDIELGARLFRSGHGIRLEKRMLCKHLKKWTFWNMVKTDIFQRGVPWMVLSLQQGAAPNDLNLSFRSRLATVLAGLLAISLLILPLAGHAAALLPAAAFLLAASLCALLPGNRPALRLLAVVLCLAAPSATFLFHPDPWAVAPALLVGVLAWSHLAFYRYVAARRGVAFALAVIPAHVVFFFGCAVSGGLGIIQHLLGVPRK
jgi:hypothetical protein